MDYPKHPFSQVLEKVVAQLMQQPARFLSLANWEAPTSPQARLAWAGQLETFLP